MGITMDIRKGRYRMIFIISFILQAFMVGSLWIIADNSIKIVELLK